MVLVYLLELRCHESVFDTKCYLGPKVSSGLCSVITDSIGWDGC